MADTTYYDDLCDEAFGSPEITNERISQAMSQFVRSMVSDQSKFDSALNANG